MEDTNKEKGAVRDYLTNFTEVSNIFSNLKTKVRRPFRSLIHTRIE